MSADNHYQPVKVKPRQKPNLLADERFHEAIERRAKMIELLKAGVTPAEAVKEIGVQIRTFYVWRQRFPQFRAESDTALIDTGSIDPDKPWRGSFSMFRARYFKHKSPWFHQRAINAIEDARPGDVILVLMHPESGKSSLLEDYCSMKLALDPDYRIAVAGERETHSRKMLARIKNRMMPDGPFPAYVARFGPFSPQPGDGRGSSQPWAASYFDVRKKHLHDERDYSMIALGITSSVIGTRTDLLLVDDVQSRRSLGNTEELVDVFRQDWLSRPAESGITVVLGSRVGVGDFYEAIIDAGLVTKVIKFPAQYQHNDDPIGQLRWLWPERYTPAQYENMRRKAGPQVWARTYMQNPEAAGDRTFTDEMTSAVLVPLRKSWTLHPPADVVSLVEGIDPGFGVNATVLCGMTPDKLHVLDGRIDEGLTSNQGIINCAEDLYVAHHVSGAAPLAHVMIEDKAFQKGLFDDEALHSYRRRYGFTVSGHQTSSHSKYDENIGIPGMARSFLREEITLPGSDDATTKKFVDAMRDQLHRWRPGKKGTQLTQDLVVALWFCWMYWRGHKHALASMRQGVSGFETKGLPYARTEVGLIVPIGAMRR